MLYIFHFLQSYRGFGIVYPFTAISSEKSWRNLMPFLLTYMNIRTLKFLMLNLDWSVKFPANHAYKTMNTPVKKYILVA